MAFNDVRPTASALAEISSDAILTIAFGLSSDVINLLGELEFSGAEQVGLLVLISIILKAGLMQLQRLFTCEHGILSFIVQALQLAVRGVNVIVINAVLAHSRTSKALSVSILNGFSTILLFVFLNSSNSIALKTEPRCANAN